MADNRIQYAEKMVGAGHPALADTLNRLALIEHNNDGTHKYVYILVSEKGAASGVAELDAASLILLGRLPAVLTGKDADSVDGFHGASLAKAGANSDITSLSGITTPLSRVQGGSGYAQAIAPIFAAQNTAASLTGTVVETTLYSTVIPGGILGPNGILRVTELWSWTPSANAKTRRVKLGGTSFQERFYASAIALGEQTCSILRNRNSQGSQVAFGYNINSFALVDSGTNPKTTSKDTSVNNTLTITGQLGNAAETLTLESVFVEVLK